MKRFTWSLVQQKVVQEALSWHQDTTEYKDYESGNSSLFSMISLMQPLNFQTFPFILVIYHDK
ncbi:hypothetical protein C5167_000817 [Papaver somniferum]|uniref:Uncharacterized protein n=1 Tax=Papaver somniferum TaxID=3469 RepID=A0A4Y7KQX7_PAPSO|nr:hypothetical protein C5167_000817 [Papaver somniferum]